MEIHPKDRPHKHFQKALNEWQAISDARKLECENVERGTRRNEEEFVRKMQNAFPHDDWSKGGRTPMASDTSTILDEPDHEEAKFQKKLRRAKDRASNPTFEEEYDAAKIHSGYGDRNLNEAIRSCIDPDKNIILNGTNLTCNDLAFTGCGEGRTFNSNVTSMTEKTAIKSCINENKTVTVDNTNLTCQDVLLSCMGGNQTKISSQAPSSIGGSQTINPSQAPSSSPSIKKRWNPFHPRILNSIYFFAYSGSLTEPPCSEWVSWRVLDQPMQISTGQWDALRDILFGQLDADCKQSSAHWQGSVARPIQSLNDRPLWRCTQNDYVSDIEKRAQLKDSDKTQ